MEGEDCFCRGLSHDFKLPLHVYKTVFCIGKNDIYQKRTVPTRFLSGENYLGAVALTPVLKGEDAVNFIYKIEQCKKAGK